MKFHAYNHETVLLGCNGAKISDVTLKILSTTYPTENSAATELQFLTSRLRSCQLHIPLKIHAYNHETVLSGCNGATISDVTLKVHIPLKIQVLSGCNGATISDVTLKILNSCL